MSLIRLRADAVPIAGCARVVRLSRDADGVLVFVEGDTGGWGRRGSGLNSEPLWEVCRAALRLQANPGTGSRIRQQAGSHRLRHGAAVGGLLASELPTAGKIIRRQAERRPGSSHRGFVVEVPVGASLLANAASGAGAVGTLRLGGGVAHQAFIGNSQTVMETPDHIQAEPSFPVQDFGNPATGTYVGLQVLVGKP